MAKKNIADENKMLKQQINDLRTKLNASEKLKNQVTDLQKKLQASQNLKNEVNDLESENDELRTENKSLQSQLRNSQPKVNDWEEELQQLVDDNPDGVESYLRRANGLPHDYNREQLYKFAHARARANGSEKFIADLQKSI